MIDERFVPVWINVRETALPRRGWVSDVLVNARVDADNKVLDQFSQGFFLRSVVLDPTGFELLNRAPTTVAASLVAVVRTADNLYANVDAGDYLSMLKRALERLGP
jgi:hypothetical protein